jgi:formate dehydrogenase major subunit
MAVTRRTFLKKAAGASVGTAVGALAGLGADLSPKVARAQELRIARAKTTPSVCCYCSVGCGLLVHTVDDQIVNIEGNPASPLNYGNLCPKGAAVFQLHVNPNRLTKTLYRRPGGTQWEVVELEWAMDRVAQLVKQARDETFIERSPEGKTLMMTPSVFSLGGALLDDEWNHIHQKLMRGLGIVAIENQARI